MSGRFRAESIGNERARKEEPLRTLLLTAALTGTRQGELFGLRVGFEPATFGYECEAAMRVTL